MPVQLGLLKITSFIINLWLLNCNQQLSQPATSKGPNATIPGEFLIFHYETSQLSHLYLNIRLKSLQSSPSPRRWNLSLVRSTPLLILLDFSCASNAHFAFTAACNSVTQLDNFIIAACRSKQMRKNLDIVRFRFFLMQLLASLIQ